MADLNVWQCTTATGVCDGLRITAEGAKVTVGEGYGYAAGVPVSGGWQLEVVKQQRGWHFLQVAPEGAFIGPRQHDGVLCLAALLIERGQVVALRDVRRRLYCWKWLTDMGGVAWMASRRETVLRVQGAVQVQGLWGLARAHVPFRVGQILTPGELMLHEVRWDVAQTGGAALILETTGVTE